MAGDKSENDLVRHRQVDFGIQKGACEKQGTDCRYTYKKRERDTRPYVCIRPQVLVGKPGLAQKKHRDAEYEYYQIKITLFPYDGKNHEIIKKEGDHYATIDP